MLESGPLMPDPLAKPTAHSITLVRRACREPAWAPHRFAGDDHDFDIAAEGWRTRSCTCCLPSLSGATQAGNGLLEGATLEVPEHTAPADTTIVIVPKRFKPDP
jgi:hypothetical protein